MQQLKLVKDKVLDVPSLERKLNMWRFQGKRIVFTNGCFDVLHRGHIEVLARARDFGDQLIVGLNADASVKLLKGRERPVMNEEDRSFLLASLHFVDAVVSFSEETPEKLIHIVRPDVLVKGGDYVPEKIVGGDFVRQYGGSVEVVPLLEGYSTTNVIQKLANT